MDVKLDLTERDINFIADELQKRLAKEAWHKGYFDQATALAKDQTRAIYSAEIMFRCAVREELQLLLKQNLRSIVKEAAQEFLKESGGAEVVRSLVVNELESVLEMYQNQDD